MTQGQGCQDAGREDLGAEGFARRRVLAGLAATAAWVPAFRIGPADAQARCAAPPDFPADLPLYQQAYENWAGDIRIEALWTCAPRAPADVVALANWAHAQGWTLRPRGSMHNWSPLTVMPDAACQTRVVLVDTTQAFTQIELLSPLPQAAVRVQAGVYMDQLLVFLQDAGLGLAASTAPGDVTIAGVLAVDGHGTGIPARGETLARGHSLGSLSNLVLSLTAVVWDETTQAYVLRTFERSHPHSAAVLTHLGRIFVTEVTLRVGPDYMLRCQSRLDIPAAELMALPAAAGPRALSRFLDQSGRAEVIWFPFTDKPWLKVWTPTPLKPLLSRKVDGPYNYVFADSIPREVSDLADQIVSGQTAATPLFTNTELAAITTAMLATRSQDLWGHSKDLLLYVKPTTLRVTANGYAIHTRRADIQRVVGEFFAQYQAMIAAWQARGEYPINGPVEIRITQLERPGDVGVPGAQAPALSALRPRADHPDWDVAVWLDLLTFPGTPGANAFFREFEQWALQNYRGDYALVRAEWSKGWGYGEQTAWSDPDFLQRHVPDSFRDGGPRDWDWALRRLNALDPHRVFSNPLLDRLLPG